jgi:hypothetical protein
MSQLHFSDSVGSNISKLSLTEEDKGSLELKTQEFMPTILIGLGGTGKEVLLRLRRLFVENMDRFPTSLSYPIYILTQIMRHLRKAESQENGTC